MRRPSLFRLLIAFALSTLATGQTPTQIQARRMLYPDGHPTFDAWKAYPSRTLSQLHFPAADKADRDEDMYGGRSDRKATATGYFHTERAEGRWWMVDPLGHLYLHNAVVDLKPGPSDRTVAAQKAAFGDTAAWMRQTHAMLLENGIHGAGAWVNVPLLRASRWPTCTRPKSASTHRA
jgi:hypothetical protein